jgi:hypothetical protein
MFQQDLIPLQNDVPAPAPLLPDVAMTPAAPSAKMVVVHVVAALGKHTDDFAGRQHDVDQRRLNEARGEAPRGRGDRVSSINMPIVSP